MLYGILFMELVQAQLGKHYISFQHWCDTLMRGLKWSPIVPQIILPAKGSTNVWHTIPIISSGDSHSKCKYVFHTILMLAEFRQPVMYVVYIDQLLLTRLIRLNLDPAKEYLSLTFSLVLLLYYCIALKKISTITLSKHIWNKNAFSGIKRDFISIII